MTAEAAETAGWGGGTKSERRRVEVKAKASGGFWWMKGEGTSEGE